MGRRKNRGGQIEPAVWKKIQTSDMSLWWGNPETLGVQVGFTDLTPLHGEWIRQMVIGSGDYTLQAHRGAYKSSCLALAIALIMVIYPRRNIIFIRKADNDVAEMIGMAAKILRTQVFQDMSHILYSQPLVITSEGGDHLTTNLFTSAMGAQQLQGLGLRSSITGKHAFYVITDDICNLDDRRSDGTSGTVFSVPRTCNGKGRPLVPESELKGSDDYFTEIAEEKGKQACAGCSCYS